MAGAGKALSFTNVQLKALGLEFEMKHGWKQEIVGKQVTVENYNKFLRLKGMRKDPDGPRLYAPPGKKPKMDYTMTMDLGL